MTKRIIAFFLVLLMTLTLASCAIEFGNSFGRESKDSDEEMLDDENEDTSEDDEDDLDDDKKPSQSQTVEDVELDSSEKNTNSIFDDTDDIIEEPENTESEETEKKETEKETLSKDTEAETKPSATIPPITAISEVSILDKVIYMFAGDTYNLQYETDTEDASDIVWTSSTKCVSVKNGVVYAEKEGYAYVSGNGGNECLINIIPSTMPTLSVNTNGATIDSKDTYTNCTITLQTENSEYCLSNASAGIRIRGNSTASYAKKPYRIKFSSKQNLLGMHSGKEYKNWVLLAEYLDDSMIRNSASLTMASLIVEEYKSDWRYVSVEINGKYNGVYVLCEQSQINEDRIDIEEANAISNELMSGYLFEVDASGGAASNKFKIYYENYGIKNLEGKDFTWTCNDEGLMIQYIALKNDNYSEDQFLFTKYYIRGIFDIIYYATYKNKAMVFAQDFLSDPSLAESFLTMCKSDNSVKLIEDTSISPMEAVDRVVDLESLARMYIFSELVCNNDDLKKSFYFWVDFSSDGTGKLTFGCPWDHDGAFVAWNSYDYRPTDEYFAAKRNPWYVMIMCNDWFTELVKYAWDDILYSANNFEQQLKILDDISKHYNIEFQKDASLWNRQHDQTQQQVLTKNWLIDRIEWLNLKFGQ